CLRCIAHRVSVTPSIPSSTRRASFFNQCSGHHRALHSFPTRRSSDLINGLMAAFARADPPLEFVQTRHEETAALMACAHAKFTRSEEHTSELQSRENLVCRLLLEKKKKKRNTMNKSA